MGTPKFDFFSSKKFEIRISTFDEELKSPYSFVNISPTLVIDTSIERSSRVLQHMETPIFFFVSKKFEIEFCPYPDFPYAEKRNHHSFVNISPTLVIYTSTERSLRVVQHGNQKN